jgi:hypothetical protein
MAGMSGDGSLCLLDGDFGRGSRKTSGGQQSNVE